MLIAEFFIRKRKDDDGNTIEEPWVMIKKSNGKVIKKLRYEDYEKKQKYHPPLSNIALKKQFSATKGC